MLQSVVLEFTETGCIVVPTDGVTVFVGPNNAGKSLVSREIEEAFLITTRRKDGSSAILRLFGLPLQQVGRRLR